MKQVNIREARRRLSDIVDAALRGESTVITRRGRQVARVQPAGQAGCNLPDLTEFRAKVKVKGKALSQAVIDGRRDARH